MRHIALALVLPALLSACTLYFDEEGGDDDDYVPAPDAGFPYGDIDASGWPTAPDAGYPVWPDASPPIPPIPPDAGAPVPDATPLPGCAGLSEPVCIVTPACTPLYEGHDCTCDDMGSCTCSSWSFTDCR